MAGSAMTFAYHKIGPVKKIVIDWTSDDAAGTASGTTAVLSGYLLRGVTDPGATAPTADYDITLSDEYGANVLANCVDDLVDRHTSNTESVDFNMTTSGARPCVSGALTVAVAAAGNSKIGQIILYLDGEVYGNV